MDEVVSDFILSYSEKNFKWISTRIHDVFVFYINDIIDDVKNILKLYAEDD